MESFDDVIVGAPQYETDEPDAGETRVYLGSPAGLEPDPIWMAYGGGRFAWYGYSVGTAGDVNGDGYDDVMVGSPWIIAGNGTAYVYYGSAAGPSADADWSVTQQEDGINTFGESVATAGDVNGDGFDDVIVGDPGIHFQDGAAYVYYGSADGLSTSPDWTVYGRPKGGPNPEFGQSVGTAGDVNGDGFGDVIIGASDAGFGGRAYVYYGSAAGLNLNPALTVQNNTRDGRLGDSVGSAGDVNGDGLDDIIIGAPLVDAPEFEEGLAVVYYGRGPRRH